MRELIVESPLSGYRNCHAVGVHSVVIGRDGKRLRRVFLTDKDHVLWQNDYDSGPYSVGFHGHHCDLTIESLHGRAFNEVLVPGGLLKLAAWRYESALMDSSRPGFVRLSENRSYGIVTDLITSLIYMPAWMHHTIFVPYESVAAWVVTEGEEDPSYQPITYSDADLSAWSADGMYQPLAERECLDLLSTVCQPVLR